MIRRRIEGEKREGKPSLTAGRTVTGAGIAALTRQHRQNLMLKRDLPGCRMSTGCS